MRIGNPKRIEQGARVSISRNQNRRVFARDCGE